MEIEVTIDIITSEIFFNDGTAFLLSSPPCLSKLSTNCVNVSGFTAAYFNFMKWRHPSLRSGICWYGENRTEWREADTGILTKQSRQYQKSEFFNCSGVLIFRQLPAR